MYKHEEFITYFPLLMMYKREACRFNHVATPLFCHPNFSIRNKLHTTTVIEGIMTTGTAANDGQKG